MEERGQGREEYEEGTEGQQAVGLRKERELCRGELPGEEKGQQQQQQPLKHRLQSPLLQREWNLIRTNHEVI